MENTSKSSNSSTSSFYTFLIGAAFTGLVGSLWYLYHLYNKPDQLSSEVQAEIDEMKQRIEEGQDELTPEVAIKILALINKQVEESLRSKTPEIESKRRKAIDNEALYNRICQEYFNSKEEAYNRATHAVLDSFSLHIDDLKEIMANISPFEVEKKIYHFHRPQFESTIPNKSKTKEAFIFFGNKFIHDMSKFNTQIVKTREDISDLDSTIKKMLVLKMRVDDSLYLKFNMTENQLRYLVQEYSLMDDPEVKSVNEQICKYDEVLYL